MDFFKELPHFVVKLGPVLSKMYGEDWENRLEVVKFLCILLLLMYVWFVKHFTFSCFLNLFVFIYQAKELQANFVHLSLLSK